MCGQSAILVHFNSGRKRRRGGHLCLGQWLRSVDFTFSMMYLCDFNLRGSGFSLLCDLVYLSVPLGSDRPSQHEENVKEAMKAGVMSDFNS